MVARRTPTFSAVATAVLLLLPPALIAQNATVTLSRSGGDVVLDWSGGAPPYRVLRSTGPTFISGNQLLAEGLTGTTFTDTEALEIGHSYFYQVRGSSEGNPPGYDMNPPRPRPVIAQLTPDSGPRGASVTIDGENFSADGSSMYVLFGGAALAEVTSVSATQLTVTVPEGAISGDVVVCVVICSEGVPFSVTIEPVGVPFNDITSLSYEEGTGSLWIGDRGTGGAADRVYEVDATGTIFERAQFNEPFVSDPSVPDGTGRIYYSNGVASEFNKGTIRYIDSSDNSVNNFRDAGDASTDPVWARGMVANDLELDPPTCYFLDGNNNTVRREPRIGFEDQNYGNFTFDFNDPAGGRFDSAGNLYVTSTTAIYKIAPDETVSLVASGFTAAAGMDLIELGDHIFLAVADEATGEIVHVNAATGETWVAADGFDSPVAAVFARDGGSGMLTLVVADASGLAGMQADRLSLAAAGYLEFEDCTLGDCRVLLSKAPTSETGDDYPTPWQLSDGKIAVPASVISKVDAGTPIYFRLRDPADPSPYVDGMEGDNEPDTPAGTLLPDVDVVQEPGVSLVGTLLIVDPDNSGNNYVVEASLTPEPYFEVLARSHTYTSWRRVYVEHDKMFKVGEFITEDSGAGTSDPTQVFVDNPGTFIDGEQVYLISGQDQQTMNGELATVALGGIQVDHIVVDSPLLNLYPGDGHQPFPNDSFPFSFVGKLSGGLWDAQPSLAVLRESYDDTFTEWAPTFQGSGFVPLWPYFVDEEGVQLDFPERTTAYFDYYDGRWNTGQPRRNFVQLMSARQWQETLEGSNPGVTLALNQTDPAAIGPNWTAVLVNTVDDLYPDPEENETFRQLVITHELGHQLNVNPPVDTTAGHDTEVPWDDGTKECLMQAFINLVDTSFRFHARPGAPTQDLFCIRTHTDDLNQDSCPPYTP